MDSEKKGTLYLIPTPIGNLEDMTLRAIRILKEVDWIAAEDTRHTRQLLSHFSISGSLLRYDEHTRETSGDMIIEKLSKGESVGLVSDAGMPGIADPGSDLVKKAIEQGFSIVPLPGANAGLTGLIASGLSTEIFCFVGFLPRTPKKQREKLEELKSFSGTLIFYEAPHRLRKTLEICLEVLGNREAAWGRELTKKFETFYRNDLKDLLRQSQEQDPRGEYVLFISGNPGAENEEKIERISPQERLNQLLQEGQMKKDAARQVAKEYNLSRREIYQWTLED